MRASRIFVGFGATGIYLAALASPSLAAPCSATFGASFVGSYTCNSLGTPVGVGGLLGGITFLDNDNILIGGNANGASGEIDKIGVTRGAGNHITGFSGTATLFSTAPDIDGGLAFAPNGVLLFTGFPSNTLGEIKPGSTSPDKTVALTGILPPVTPSVGSLGFVPAGFAGAGSFKILSYSAGGWYDATLTADGGGTYDIGVSLVNVPGGGPEGIAYVAGTNAGFVGDSVLIDQYAFGIVEAYTIDANGDPILASAQDFLTGLSGAEGAVIDPLTGDFIFSTFGGGNQVVVVSGFEAPPPPDGVPEPASLFLLGSGLVGMALLSRRRKADPACS